MYFLNTNILCFIKLILTLNSVSILAEFSHNSNQRYLNNLIRESYNEVSAHVISYFNERCNLALQNCLFQTQWDRVFGKDKIGRVHTLKNKRHNRNNSSSLVIRNIMSRSTNNINSNTSYYYCQAFLIAKFCIDDYLKKSNDNIQCVNGTDGNSPNEFKRSIYKNQCKLYYSYFFDSFNSSSSLISRYEFFKYYFFILIFYRLYKLY